LEESGLFTFEAGFVRVSSCQYTNHELFQDYSRTQIYFGYNLASIAPLIETITEEIGYQDGFCSEYVKTK